jgi:hypothetical protein
MEREFPSLAEKIKPLESIYTRTFNREFFEKLDHDIIQSLNYTEDSLSNKRNAA